METPAKVRFSSHKLLIFSIDFEFCRGLICQKKTYENLYSKVYTEKKQDYCY